MQQRLLVLFVALGCVGMIVATKEGKWKMFAKGKGMQNLYTYGGGGGGGGGYGGGGGGGYGGGHDDYGHHEQKVIYYPVPIHVPVHSHYNSGHKEETKVSVIPIYGGGGYGGGYGGGGYGGGYGGGHGGYARMAYY